MTGQLDQIDLTYIEHSIKSNRMHILFKYILNIAQDKSYIKPKNKSINLRRLKLYKTFVPTTME